MSQNYTSPGLQGFDTLAKVVLASDACDHVLPDIKEVTRAVGAAKKNEDLMSVMVKQVNRMSDGE